ncbi:unnamed protein product [Pocillopora meandrina]|uniref:Uncharacterized protein n=1 Tax=Pocillopora meandrina TaxID=46732 RepID=A0AAU9X995_9CNID|nr:unnamed protein product [Pocillopora meandrina]
MKLQECRLQMSSRGMFQLHTTFLDLLLESVNIVNDSHEAEMSNFKKSCQKSSCRSCKVILTAYACGLEGLCMVACDEGNDTFNNGKESPGTGTSIEGEHDDKKVCSTFEQTISATITFYQFKRYSLRRMDHLLSIFFNIQLVLALQFSSALKHIRVLLQDFFH